MLAAAAKSADYPGSSHFSSDILSGVKMELDDGSQENSEAE